MKWHLWQVVISGIHSLLLTAAKPTSITAITTTVAIAATPFSSSYDLWKHVNRTCLSHECSESVNMQHLQRLQSNMKPAANPCENFHEYACGNWQLSEKKGRSSSTMMKVADEALTEKYVQLFKRGIKEQEREERDTVFEKMLRYYHVCKERGAQLSLSGYYEQLCSEGLSRMRNTNWIEMVAFLGRYGYSGHFLQMHVEQRNATYYSITILPHNVHKRVNLSAAVYELLKEHTQQEHATLNREFQALESDLEQIIGGTCNEMDNDADECDLRETLTFESLQQRSSDIDWQQFISVQLGRVMRESDLIVVDDLEMLQKLARYLNAAEASNSGLFFLYSLARFLNYMEQQPYNILQTGASSYSCIRHMRKVLYIPMTYLYEHAYYSHVRADSDHVISSIFEKLKLEFSHTLTQNRMQFSGDTLAYLQQKLYAMRLNIGNLPVNVPAQFYDYYLANLNISDNFYYNHLHALHHVYMQRYRFADLQQLLASSPFHSFELHMPDFPNNVDATPYYFCLSNMIIIPHAYLQMPFYTAHFWPVLLYGDLATTLGHELMHAFDNKFIEYDAMGSLNEVYSKRVMANTNFSRNFDCLKEGTEFVSERIADISGTRLALNAFLKDPEFMKRNGKLFFVQFAQFFCGHADWLEFQADDDTHDLDSVRLNFTLAHLPEFAEVYGCPAGSPMNPETKCEMW